MLGWNFRIKNNFHERMYRRTTRPAQSPTQIHKMNLILTTGMMTNQLDCVWAMEARHYSFLHYAYIEPSCLKSEVLHRILKRCSSDLGWIDQAFGHQIGSFAVILFFSIFPAARCWYDHRDTCVVYTVWEIEVDCLTSLIARHEHSSCQTVNFTLPNCIGLQISMCWQKSLSCLDTDLNRSLPDVA